MSGPAVAPLSGAGIPGIVSAGLTVVACLVLAPYSSGIVAYVRAILWGEASPPIDAKAREYLRYVARLPDGFGQGYLLGAIGAVASLACVVMPGAQADPWLAALILLGARTAVWSDARDRPASAFAQVREQRGAVVALVLIGMMAGFAPAGASPSLGGILLAAGVLVALSTGVLAARDLVADAARGGAGTRMTCDLMMLGWLIWLSRLVWPHSDGVWAAPLWTIARVVAGAVVLGLAQGLWFPRMTQRPLATALLLGGLALVLLDPGGDAG